MQFFRFLSFLILAPVAGMTQNLFPNGGFEQFNQCPTYTSQINRCVGWDSCLGTADFYHCGYYAPSTLGNYGIPASGNGVIGLVASVPGSWSQPQGRFYAETISGELAKTLEPGATYRIQADLLYNTVQLPPPGPCLQLGFYFYKSANPPVVPAGSINYNPFQPQVGVQANLIPVASYGTFTMNYTPDSCFDKVMIGLFSNDSTFSTSCYNNGSGIFYFDIDNISMQKIGDAPLRTTTANSSNPTICKNNCTDFNGSSNLPVRQWNWSFPGAATTTSAFQNPTGICYPATGSYNVTLISSYECGTDTVNLTSYIEVKDVPYVRITNDTNLYCYGNSIQLTAGSTDAVYWNTGQTQSSISVNLPGTYIAFAENECGTTSDTTLINFENCPCELFLPNAFTPDNDGNNDTYQAVSACELKEYQLEVYDRWGKKLYTTQSLEKGWDGRYNGEICPQGIYAVTLTWTGYKDYLLKRTRKSTTVALLR